MNTGRWVSFLKAQWFTLAIFAALGLAWLAPSAGSRLNPGDWAKSLAIIGIFFSSGLGLKTEEVLRGFAGWRAHLFIQSFGFFLFPAIVWSLVLPWRDSFGNGLLVGIYLLGVLPTTITSCVVFTQLAGGRTSVALFNAIAGNLLGIALSPTLLLFLIGTGGLQIELDAGVVVVKLASMVVAPFAAGQAARWFLRDRLAAAGRRFTLFNSCAILLIVYLAFCEALAAPSPTGAGSVRLLPLAALIPFHVMMVGLAWLGGKLAGFARPERIAIIFCAPQKTLALGLPMLAACLADRPDLLGAASLPIIVYHVTQLAASGLFKAWLTASTAAESVPER